MYVYFEHSPGKWLVGSYNVSGNWIPESEHKSRLEANCRVVSLNRNSFPKNSQNSPTVLELIDYIGNLCKEAEKKNHLTRILNVVKFLSNYYVYTEQITQDEFLKVSNAGKKTWEFYLSVYCRFKSHITHKNLINETSAGDRFAEMIWRQVL